MKKNKQLRRILPNSPQKHENPKTIEDVENDIEEFKKTINKYRNDLEQTTTPMVQEFPFFSLPSTRRDLVNSALESLWVINKTSYDTIAQALDTINNNTDSLNNLIRIVAVAEAELYTELNRLSTVSKKESDNVNDLSNEIRQTAVLGNKLSVIQKSMAILRRESITNLKKRFYQIDSELSKKALAENVYTKAETNQELKKKADEVKEIKDSLKDYAKTDEVKAIEESLKDYAKTDEVKAIEERLKEYAKADVVKELKDNLDEYAKADAVNTIEKKLNRIIIAFSSTTAILTAGLIASILL